MTHKAIPLSSPHTHPELSLHPYSLPSTLLPALPGWGSGIAAGTPTALQRAASTPQAEGKPTTRLGKAVAAEVEALTAAADILASVAQQPPRDPAEEKAAQEAEEKAREKEQEEKEKAEKASAVSMST